MLWNNYLYQMNISRVAYTHNPIKEYNAMESRIKEVRKSRHIIQAIVAFEIGVTQQTFSKYERDVSCAKIDVLIKIAQYFNVTTDYLLGISDVKRDLSGQMKMSKDIDEYFELIETFKDLDIYDQELLWNIVQQMKKASMKRMQVTQERNR